jgi:excisionase family DNA binding protein
MSSDSQLLYTPEHAGDKIDVGRTTIYGLMASGELQSVKIGRSRRIPAAALDAYVAKLVQGSNGEK